MYEIGPRCTRVEYLPMPDPSRYEEFADLIEFSTSRVLSYLHALLLNWDDAEDIFQETCLVLWQKFDEFRPGTSFLGWAMRIAQHKAMNFQKKQRRRTIFAANVRDALLTEFAARSSEATSADLASLSDCMDRLAQDDLRMVKSCYIERVPVRELADTMGRSPESVHNTLHRIRTWLLNCIRRELKQADTPAHVNGTIQKEKGGP
jgi:RNA polymerase sigma-70 factor, ECF subfamily